MICGYAIQITSNPKYEIKSCELMYILVKLSIETENLTCRATLSGE